MVDGTRVKKCLLMVGRPPFHVSAPYLIWS